MIPILAVVNLCIACTRFYFTLRQRRLIALAWFLVAYFSFFYLPVSISGDFRHIQKFTDGSVIISADYIQRVIVFVFLFNLAFLSTEYALGKVLLRTSVIWSLPKNSPRINKLNWCFGIMLFISSIFYGIATQDFSYRDYVEYQGSSWTVVFLWAASSIVTLAAMQKRYWLAGICTLPYLYFAAALSVRSFALLSLIPMVIVFGQQTLSSGKGNMVAMLKKAALSGALGLVLIIFSSLVIQQKSGRGAGIVLPDSSMPFGSVATFKLRDVANVSTGFDAIELYIRNLTNPLTRIFKLEFTPITDPPVIIARLLEGQPKNWPVYTHYPMLWYSDAYIAFGYFGLVLGICWAAVLVFFESLIARNAILLGLMLPYYCWHTYMLVRGATAGAAVPFSYSAYISIMTALLFFGFSVFKKRRARSKSAETFPQETLMSRNRQSLKPLKQS